MTADLHLSKSQKQTDFLAPAPTVSTTTWVGPLVGTQWSATPIDAPLAPPKVPSENTTQHLERMAPGAFSQSFVPFSRFKRDGLNHAQTSELGRLSIGKGGLPLVQTLIFPEHDH